MRNKFGASAVLDAADFRDTAHSRDQLSIAWNPDGQVIAAWPTSRDGMRSWEVEVGRFRSDLNLTQAINLGRGGQAGDLRLSDETMFLTTIPEFSER